MAQYDPTNKRLLQDKSFAYLVSFPELLVAPSTPVTSPSLLGKRRKKMSDNKRTFGKWKYSILLLVVNIVYIYLGTLVFVHIEAAEWEREDVYHKEYLNHLKTHLKKPDDVLPKLLELQKEMCVKDNDLNEEEKWTFTGSFTYCLSILSTIGYGVMSPHDTLSRVVSMLYALFGLPIYAVYLNQAYKALTKFTSALSRRVLWCFRKKKEEEGKEEEQEGDVSNHKALNSAQLEDTTNSMNKNKRSKDKMQHDSKYRKLSSEDCHIHGDQNTLADATETTAETSLGSGSGNSIEKLSDEMPSLTASEEDGQTKPSSVNTSTCSFYLLNLLITFLLLVSYFCILLFWSPVLYEKDRTLLDEIYWLVMRFTTIGFGDEYRDIAGNPRHLPGNVNNMLVSLVVLPLGIAMASHIFYLYRKIGAERIRRAKDSTSKGIRVKFQCECVTNSENV